MKFFEGAVKLAGIVLSDLFVISFVIARAIIFLSVDYIRYRLKTIAEADTKNPE